MLNRNCGALTLSFLLVLSTILASGMLTPMPVLAQAADIAVPPVQVLPQENGVTIAFGLPVGSAADSATALAAAAISLPTVPYHGYSLPMHFETFTVPQDATPTLQVQQVTAGDLPAGIEPAPSMLPPALDWKPAPGAQTEPLQLPSAPAFIVREGYIHGQKFVVVAVSPVYQEGGIVKVATGLQVFAAGAQPLQDDVLASANATAPNEVVAVPVNDAAFKNAHKLVVTTPGMQEVTYGELGLGGEPANVLLTFNGQPVAVEKLTDRLRFYVESVGDRWNATSVYWLTLEGGPLMGPTAQAPAADAGIAYARGRWVDNKIYDSIFAGADGDHWFNSTMKFGTEGSQIVPASVPVAVMLPARSEPWTINANVTPLLTPSSSYCLSGDPGYRLEAQLMSGANVLETQVQAWNPAPSCSLKPFSVVSFATSANLDSVQLKLLPSPYYYTGINLDSVEWERPVNLDFGGAAANGTDFWTRAGAATFAMTNLPNRWQLYNVTVPNTPQIMTSGGAGNASFNQGADAPASHYVLVNLDATRKPVVQTHSPVDFGNVLAANAIYIGPASFAGELTPLITLRQQQGYAPLYVDVQKIFDVYGFGHYSAVAVRNFLRSQTGWQNTSQRISVVLVGDGSYDPHNYEARQFPDDPNRVPPYMADVDPFIREVPCDQCYAQLNGDDPKTGDSSTRGTRAWFAADIWLGRFPVRSVNEVTGVVSKIVAYETTGTIDDLWRGRHIFLADNYIKALDSANNADIDTAGDFATISDAIIKLFPAIINPQRIYLDAAPTRRVVTSSGGAPIQVPGKAGYYLTEPRSGQDPWRINDLASANSGAIAALGGGAGMVVFNGHSNHWQYARMEGTSGANWLLYTNDVDLLNNRDKLFIGLSMTCYTSQFAKPAANGTLDEVLFRRAEGGAAAMWGSSGLSVVHGHDQLQRGFLNRLWSQAAGTQRMGELVEAGYTELLVKGGDCCQDALMTFLLLGDPLTKARVNGNTTLHLPRISKN